ncbi:GntR family transcriptional regulator [Dactylosporangium sp. AC04546]|uniref:GntR family transcriptional regulator n=1 Tax=Dactylosporangium sp. AC04546 TaxID=2862460 RepID=UPI001EE0FB41|nr:GntR family transcriptional regulator [Dactylosporangium sp. AC04546]WVK80682.1 GntR family transcriptional regulator [Dactylosporangium sp. AC04546]
MWITTGELVQGTLYTVGELAAQLGTSQTPVREALIQLANEGLVDVVRNRGFRVSEIADEDLDEIVSCRLLLEVPLVAQVASMDVTGSIADLRRLADETVAAAERKDMETFLTADREFHLALLRLAGNRRVVDIVARLRDQTRLYGIRSLAEEDNLLASANEHGKILDAVEAGDASASDLMERHIRHARGIWAGRVEAQG